MISLWEKSFGSSFAYLKSSSCWSKNGPKRGFVTVKSWYSRLKLAPLHSPLSAYCGFPRSRLVCCALCWQQVRVSVHPSVAVPRAATRMLFPARGRGARWCWSAVGSGYLGKNITTFGGGDSVFWFKMVPAELSISSGGCTTCIHLVTFQHLVMCNTGNYNKLMFYCGC